jgi:glycosyltransferase involved in cell wall biosynthesis
VSNRQVRLLLITPNFESNSLGRTYCLWLLARYLGWDIRVVGVAGASLWEPVRCGDFADSCTLLGHLGPPQQQQSLEKLALWSDVLIAVKPLPTSFGVASALATRTSRPLLVDIDDPDFEYRVTWQPLRRRIKDRVSGRRRELLRLRTLSTTVPVMVSNPVLQETYGGVIVPHVRHARSTLCYSDTEDIVVRFVGTLHAHMGVELLRQSVATFRGQGIRLEVTGPAPKDAKPWESWLGVTSFERGQSLVASADVVVLPSLPRSWSLGQLPAKLVDAKMTGRPVIASDLAPIRWALGDTGLLIPPRDVDALSAALTVLRNPERRRELGSAAHRRAMELFDVRSVAPGFARYVSAAIDNRCVSR